MGWECSECEWCSDISGKGEKLHQSLRGNNLVSKCGFTEGSCVIPNKSAYVDDETWTKVVKVVATDIIKIGGDQCCFC